MPSLSITLRLLTGKETLAPAAFAVIDAFVDLEVRSRDYDRDLFQATFALGKGAAPDYALLTDGIFEPGRRLGIAVRIANVDETLIDGFTTDLQSRAEQHARRDSPCGHWGGPQRKDGP